MRTAVQLSAIREQRRWYGTVWGVLGLVWSPGPPLCHTEHCHQNYLPPTKHRDLHTQSIESNQLVFLRYSSYLRLELELWYDLVKRFLCKSSVVWQASTIVQFEDWTISKWRIIWLSPLSVTEMKYCDLKHVTCQARPPHPPPVTVTIQPLQSGDDTLMHWIHQYVMNNWCTNVIGM